MAIQVELWQPVIKEQLFKSNSFLNYFRNADEYVIGGRVVHIPQSGGGTVTVKNRQQLPGIIRKRTDTDITFTLDEYTTDPVTIVDADKKELSYDKTASVVREEAGSMMEFAGNNLLYDAAVNAAAANKIATTGADASIALSGATGTRKILTEADIRKAKVFLDQQNVMQEGRYLLLTPEMEDHLRSDSSLKYAFQQTIDLSTGQIGRLYGFTLLSRSTVLRLSSSQVVKDPAAAEATSDTEAALFWQQDMIDRCLGDMTMFDNYGRAEYYGDIFSFLLRAKARANRADNKGYGMIYRAA